MTENAAVIEGASIVLAGSMNPGIFHPQWLARNGLIRAGEAETTENLIVTPEFARFELDWATVEVLPDRLSIVTQNSPLYGSLRDMAFGIVRLLPHTPVNAIGLNRSAHFPLSNSETYQNVGHRLAPKVLWDDILKRPGMRRLTIQGERPEDVPGMVLVTVEPSVQVANGLFIDINDHFQRPTDKPDEIEDWLEDVFTEYWKTHLAMVETTQARILEFAEDESNG